MKKKYPIYTIFIGLAFLFFIITGVRFYDSYTGTEEESGFLRAWMSPLIMGIAMLWYAWYHKKKEEKEKVDS